MICGQKRMSDIFVPSFCKHFENLFENISPDDWIDQVLRIFLYRLFYHFEILFERVCACDWIDQVFRQVARPTGPHRMWGGSKEVLQTRTWKGRMLGLQQHLECALEQSLTDQEEDQRTRKLPKLMHLKLLLAERQMPLSQRLLHLRSLLLTKREHWQPLLVPVHKRLRQSQKQVWSLGPNGCEFECIVRSKSACKVGKKTVWLDWVKSIAFVGSKK